MTYEKPKPLKLGKLKIETPIILAPLCGVTCNAFRLLCKDFGAGLVFSEKIEEAKYKGNPEKFDDLLSEERPVGAQIIGNDPAELKNLLELIGDKADLIDFNAGCSKANYLKLGWGGWFSHHPKELENTLSKIRELTDKPFTIKVRLGTNKKKPEIFQTLKACENVGMDAITIHARFVEHNFREKADWNILKEIKERANIPVIANGDIATAEDVAKIFEKTNCDGAMIGRAAMGNPFIFSDAKALLLEGKIPENHCLEERIKAFKQFVVYIKKYRKNYYFTSLKAQATWFTSRARHTAKLRAKIQRTRSEEELFELLEINF